MKRASDVLEREEEEVKLWEGFYSVRRKEVNNEKTLLQDKKNKLGIIFIILWENKKRKKGFDC